MRSCNDCPGSVKCSSVHLYPILVRVYGLYASGTRDKFDILFSLSDEDEAALEQCNAQVSRDCWTKSALLAIGELVGQLAIEGRAMDEVEQGLYDTIRTARDAFAHFPWHLEELVEQSADLYAHIHEQCPDPQLCEHITKRSFMKACKEIAYAH